ncbi:hypothetical protein Q5752_002952 [Cryptotrichosporon argae]
MSTRSLVDVPLPDSTERLFMCLVLWFDYDVEDATWEFAAKAELKEDKIQEFGAVATQKAQEAGVDNCLKRRYTLLQVEEPYWGDEAKLPKRASECRPVSCTRAVATRPIRL